MRPTGLDVDYSLVDAPTLEREDKVVYWPYATAVIHRLWDQSTPLKRMIMLNTHPMWDGGYYRSWIYGRQENRHLRLETFWDSLVQQVLTDWELYDRDWEKYETCFLEELLLVKGPLWRILLNVLPWRYILEELADTMYPSHRRIREISHRNIEVAACLWINSWVKTVYTAREKYQLDEEPQCTQNDLEIPVGVVADASDSVKARFQEKISVCKMKHQYWTNPMIYCVSTKINSYMAPEALWDAPNSGSLKQSTAEGAVLTLLKAKTTIFGDIFYHYFPWN